MINNNILFKCNILIHFEEKKHPSQARIQLLAKGEVVKIMELKRLLSQ